MEFLFMLMFFCLKTHAAVEKEKVKFCKNLQCDDNHNASVCGLREEGQGYRLKLFANECELLKFTCHVETKYAYGSIGMEYCERSFSNSNKESGKTGQILQFEKRYWRNRTSFPFRTTNLGKQHKFSKFKNESGETGQIFSFEQQIRENRKSFPIRTRNLGKEDTFSNFMNESGETGHIFEHSTDFLTKHEIDPCSLIDYDCSYPSDAVEVCGIRTQGPGFVLRLFSNKCDLLEYNCKNNLQFKPTDLNMNICDGLDRPVKNDEPTHTASLKNEQNIPDFLMPALSHSNFNSSGFNNPGFKSPGYYHPDLTNPSYNRPGFNNPGYNSPGFNNPGFNNSGINGLKNVIIVDGNTLEYNGDINKTIDAFFASTHEREIPIKQISREAVDLATRRLLLKVIGPVKVFVPWIVIPANVSEDPEFQPTLKSCYHKCPQKCPDTYAPVCGVPGMIAREPSIMFKNHCFMDVAQCKMNVENLSPTAVSSAYVESPFVMCLGDGMDGVYQFLPLVRTLQRMGRLKRKGHFRYRIRNMGYNNYMKRQSRPMGKK